MLASRFVALSNGQESRQSVPQRLKIEPQTPKTDALFVHRAPVSKCLMISFRQQLFEVSSRVARRHLCHRFRRPLRDNLAPAVPALRPQVHNPVRRLDHIQIMLDLRRLLDSFAPRSSS